MACDKRELDNWLDSYVEWVLPRSEAPESMVRWAGLFALASIAKRKVKWPRSLLGGYEVYPNLYLIFIAEPAVVRKSTTVGFAESLIDHQLITGMDAVTFAGTVTSHSKLIQAMIDSPDQSVAIVSSEFSSLIQTTPEHMYETLIDLYDNKKVFKWETWAHGTKTSENPVINLFAATTPAWISSQPPEYFVEGGFASRVIFVYEEFPRQREIYYDHLDLKALNELEEKLAKDLSKIAKVKGEFRHNNKGTKEYIREWYKSQDVYPDDPRLKGFHGRKHTHAHKIAMLFSLAERSDRIVTKQHWDRAVELLDYIEEKLPKAFHSLGKNPHAVLMDRIITYLEREGEASQKQLAGRFYTEGLTMDQLNSALGYLCIAGKLRANGELNPTYKVAK